MAKIAAIMMMVMVVTFVTMEGVIGQQDPNNNAAGNWQDQLQNSLNELQKNTGMTAEQFKQKAEELQRNSGMTAEQVKQKADEYYNKLKDHMNNNNNNNNNQG